jgi:hypothetical protein
MSVQRVTWPTLTSFLFLKYGLLTATVAFLYLVAKRLFADQRWAAIAAPSPLLLYHIGWNLHEGVTQTMALICAVAASMWSCARLLDWRLLLSVGAAAVVTAPFVAWLIGGRHDLVALYGSAMARLPTRTASRRR